MKENLTFEMRSINYIFVIFFFTFSEYNLKYWLIVIFQSIVLIAIGPEFKFPLFISMNVLFTNPTPSISLPRLELPECTDLLTTATQTEQCNAAESVVPRTISHGDLTQTEEYQATDDEESSAVNTSSSSTRSKTTKCLDQRSERAKQEKEGS